MDSTFGVESPAYVAIRAALSICAVGLIGALSLRMVVMARYAGPDASALRDAVNRRLMNWIDVLALVAIVVTVARLAAQHAAVFGVDVAPTAESLSTLLIRASWGRTWWLAFGTATAVSWIAPRLRGNASVTWGAFGVFTLGFALSQPWSGHAAASEQPAMAIATQLVHVLGAGGWVGGLALLTFVAIPAARSLTDEGNSAPDERIASLVRAFSPTALVSAALLGVSGTLTAWENLGGLAPLWQSSYGRTLLLKLALLAIVAGTGAYNWRRVLPALGQPSSSSALRRSSVVELSAATLVLLVTAILVATPMPGD